MSSTTVRRTEHSAVTRADFKPRPLDREFSTVIPRPPRIPPACTYPYHYTSLLLRTLRLVNLHHAARLLKKDFFELRSSPPL